MGDFPSKSARAPAPQRPTKAEPANMPLVTFEDFLTRFRRFRAPILLVCLLVGIATFFVARENIKTDPKFTSFTDIEILPSDLEMGFARSAIGGTRDSQIASLVRSISEELKSDEVLTRAVTDVFGDLSAQAPVTEPESVMTRVKNFFEWVNYGAIPASADDPLDTYRKAIEIESIDGSFVMRLSATLPDAQQAADLANALSAAYSQIEQKRTEKGRAEMRALFTLKINQAEDELRSLIDRELELGALPRQAGVAADTAGLSTEAAAELRSNQLAQEAVIQTIASLRSDLVSREIGSSGGGLQPTVLRAALPAELPSGPTPAVQALAFAAGLFVFLIGCLIVATMLAGFRRTRT